MFCGDLLSRHSVVDTVYPLVVQHQASWCDGKHVVFGQVLADDLPHLVACEAVGSASGLPLHPIVVVDCGQLAGNGLVPNAPVVSSSTSVS